MNTNRIAFGILFSIVVTMSLSVLSASPSFAQTPGSGGHGPPLGWVAHNPIHIKRSATSSPTGLSPSQITHIYGLDQLNCYGTQDCGAGQTIAIVDAYGDPNIESDLATFSSAFGLPPCTSSNGCFTIITPHGNIRNDQGWGLEESLDVEWAHAVAPGAKIVLAEAKSNQFSDLITAIGLASSQSGVHQVSMSWGGSEFSGESGYDGAFEVNGVSFTASSGDSGSGVQWPAVSPYVVGVGGTTLNLDSNGNLQSETAWKYSGGGISSYVSIPSYQNGFNTNSGRGVPDVSYDADPNSGFPVYDSYGYQGASGWFQVGGTSAGAPQWAAIIAIANSNGAGLSSQSFGTDSQLYNAAGSTTYSTNYRDITSGSNGGFSAGTGYDFVTGLGSPLSNNLIPFISGGTPPTPSLSASANPTTIDTTQSSTITVSTSDGANGVLVGLSTNLGTLSASTCTTSSGSCSVSFSSSVTGTATITVSASGYTGTSVSVTVNPVASPDFGISSSPSSLTIAAGSSGSSTITVSSSNGFNSAVSLSTSTASGITATVNPTSVTPASGGTASSSLTIDVSSTVGPGTYTVTVKGTSGSLSHSTTVNVTVPSSTGGGSLTVSVTPDSTSTYSTNSWAILTVHVSSSGTPVSGASVSVTVTDPNGHTATGSGTTNSSGDAAFKYRISPHAATGTYDVTATASAAGYTNGSDSTSFTVG